MLLKDLYKRLALGELSNLSMAKGSTLDELKRPAIVQYANEALLKLYSKFILNYKDAEVTLIGGQTLYPLDDSVIKVLQIKDQDGEPVPLNNRENKWSLYTPSPTILDVPTTDTHDERTLLILSLLCQARHDVLDVETPDQAIKLHYSLEPALTSYIAYKVFSFMGGQDNTSKAAEHMANYENTCVEAIDKDLVNSSTATTNTNFERNGWR